ncbi:aminoglycoside 3-N-acetyltransferase [Nannocystis exedens]|uniref:Aminoglycoside N(3)-acetyltransferase n=1 Tax=Nannocystis exedens TaxID=54 RepID=A0A1I1Z3E8_9BACT|nr:aminoglycoside 3-N-acetyltransferase [Nannocystis exedens]PCC75179.1 AAC(3) family N-acetyltransferase [Nannocystis exedens]SFE26285.1 aminoglycoside 3-N-acetyltransferase [Nannocystis exedens]
MNFVCPRMTREMVARDCAALGVVPGDTVMVHASLRAVGPLLGGPDALIDGILAAVGEAGTMLVYLGCPSPYDDLGRGLYSPEDERFIEEHCPPFDPYLTRANREFGVLPEFFRGHPRVRCSANAGMRMAAVGARADFLTRDHGPNYGLGEGSPLARLCEIGGKVLLVGSDLDQVTLLHYAEAVAPIEGKRLAHVRVPVLQDGVRTWIEVEEFDTNNNVCDWPDRFFGTIVERFIAAGLARSGAIGAAESHLLPARALVEFAVPIMTATAAQLA